MVSLWTAMAGKDTKADKTIVVYNLFIFLYL